MGLTGGKKFIRCSRVIATALAAAMLLIFAAACDGMSPPGNPGGNERPAAPADTQPPGDAPGTSDIEEPVQSVDVDPTLPPMTGPPAVPVVLMPLASGEKVEENDSALIDYSNTADGYIMIKWLAGETAAGLRVIITGPSGVNYQYTLKDDGEFEVFPLSDGNGSYTVQVLEMLDDGSSRGAVMLTATFDVTLIDEFAPFLHPNQYVNFDEDCRSVAIAAELVTANADFLQKIAAIYEFVIDNITYDTDLANEIVGGMHPNYLPVIDNVLDKKKGICFDFAALMTAMLRSQGIPTKLVVGDVNNGEGNVRHAWLNVYSDVEGWIDAVVFFDGENWQMMDPTFASSVRTASALSEFIGDGSNYVELYLY